MKYWPFTRYANAITLRLDKYRADPASDAQRLTELKAQEQRYWRLVAERKGAQDARMLEFRWLLEELRVSFFCPGTAHPAAREPQAAGEGLGAVELLSGTRTQCGLSLRV